MAIAFIVGMVAGGVIILSSLFSKDNSFFRGLIAGIICWSVSIFSATAQNAWKPGYIITIIFLVCALYVSKDYPRLPRR
jgi:hypothetical protein